MFASLISSCGKSLSEVSVFLLCFRSLINFNTRTVIHKWLLTFLKLSQVMTRFTLILLSLVVNKTFESVCELFDSVAFLDGSAFSNFGHSSMSVIKNLGPDHQRGHLLVLCK